MPEKRPKEGVMQANWECSKEHLQAKKSYLSGTVALKSAITLLASGVLTPVSFDIAIDVNKLKLSVPNALTDEPLHQFHIYKTYLSRQAKAPTQVATKLLTGTTQPRIHNNIIKKPKSKSLFPKH